MNHRWKLVAGAALLVCAVGLAPPASAEGRLPRPGITPDHPLYFLDTLLEEVQWLLTRTPAERARLAVSLAGEKAAETLAMAQAGKPREALMAAARYGTMVSRAALSLADAARSGEGFDAALVELVATATSVHLEVLGQAYQLAPAEARPALTLALQAGQESGEMVLQALIGGPHLQGARDQIQRRLNEALQGLPLRPGR